ncbi:uncharacterized protein C12orf42 homolog [Neofelis nebulosa]|uniref:uncharacterized protein C12orf42 homolog n=1 Tax=Neofelis nebulosa TaxID=61452 RepID=UPI00272CA2F2|nr:uncharacterized protein C12orf42 homolog [Neofelis nebulosa]
MEGDVHVEKVFPGKVQTPGACRRLLCAQQYSIPRSPAVSTAFSEEEIHGEASFSQTPSSEWDETRLIFAVRQEMKKRARGAPNAAWSRPLLEKSMTKKPIRPSHRENKCDLMTSNVMIQVLHNDNDSDSDNDNDNDSDNDSDNYYYHDRFIPHLTSSHHVPYTVLSISHYFMKASYNTFRQHIANVDFSNIQSSAETFRKSRRDGFPCEASRRHRPLQEKPGPVGLPALGRIRKSGGVGGGGRGCHGTGDAPQASSLIRGKGGRGEKRGPKADASLHGNLAGAPVPLPAGAPTHLPSKRLIKAPPRPRVNAPLH